MKTTHLFLIAALVFLFACQDQNIVQDELNDDNRELIIDEAVQSIIMDDIMADIDLYSSFGDGLKSAEVKGGCPIITIERFDTPWPRKVVIDFGEGCEKNGKLKAGKMIIEKSGPWWEAGSVRRVTFDGYQIDGKWIGGVKEIANITEEEGNAKFLIEGKIVMEWMKNDTTEIRVERNFSKTQEWILGFRDKDVKAELIINGECSIDKRINKDEKKINKVFNDVKLVFGCRFPQGGVSEFKVKTFDNLQLNFNLDYGTEGEASEKCKENCDCMATLSWDDGSEDIDLSARWWKEARETNK